MMKIIIYCKGMVRTIPDARVIKKSSFIDSFVPKGARDRRV